MTALSGSTTLVGILGWPVEHSLSPRMHNAAFAALGLDWAYVALATPPERLEDAVRGLAALGFVGANVTTPHKQAVTAMCETDAPSVNTLVVRDSRIEGWSTDAAILDGLAATHPVIVGAGGSATAFLEALPHARQFSRRGAWPPDVSDADLVVNATSERDAVVVELRAGQTLVDLPYPETATAAAARTAGARVVTGLEVLVAQGDCVLRALDGRPSPGRRHEGRRRLVDVTLTLTTAGESHGPALVAILGGVPAGLRLDARGNRRRPPAAPAGLRAQPASGVRGRRVRGPSPASVTARRSAHRSRCSSPIATTRTGSGG